MTPAMRSLMAAAVLSFVAAPAFAECDMVVVPEMHVSKNSTADELRAAATKIQDANAKLEKYNTCIDSMIKDKMPADATKEQIAAHEAEINKHTDAYNKALDNLQKAAVEYNEAVKAFKASSKG